MLLKRNENNHNDQSRVYDHPTDENRYIRIRCTETNEIIAVELVRVWEIAKGHYDGKVDAFIPKGIIYLENVCHGMENQTLDTNALMLFEDRFEEVKDYAA